MGRLATGLAVSAINADNVPPSKKLPRVSFVDALMPGHVEVTMQKPSGERTVMEVCEAAAIPTV